jgi:hypothetical protein
MVQALVVVHSSPDSSHGNDQTTDITLEFPVAHTIREGLAESRFGPLTEQAAVSLERNKEVHVQLVLSNARLHRIGESLCAP